MADSKEDHTHPKLTIAETEALCDRLVSRGVSRLFADQPQTQADMQLAARVIRHFIHEIERAAASSSDEVTARALRELLGGR
jgi:hypothetical protein